MRGIVKGGKNDGFALTGDAVAADVASGKTFYNTDPRTKVTGTAAAGGLDYVGTVSYSGTYAATFNTKAKYLGTAADGTVVMIHQGSGNTSYENIQYTLTSAPAGVTLVAQTGNHGATSGAGVYQGCAFLGLTGKVNIAIAINTQNATYDYYQFNMTLTYV